LLGLLASQLERSGFRHHGVGSGHEALHWLAENDPRLVLLDYSLPDMSASELVDQWRLQGIDVPFIVVTGNGSEAVAVEMMKRGARDYLIKSPSLPELLPKVLEHTLAELEHERQLRTTEAELRRRETQLRKTHAELEQRVKQRTAELTRLNVRLKTEIEERRRAEEQVRLREAELASVARLSTVGEMMAELAHELSQPLSAIASYAQACERLIKADDAVRRAGHCASCQTEEAVGHRDDLVESVQQITAQADRAAEVIRGVRRLLRNADVHSDHVSVNELIRGVATMLEVETQSAEVEICLELNEPPPMVGVDRVQVEQVLINLIRNAIDALSPDRPSPDRPSAEALPPDAETEATRPAANLAKADNVSRRRVTIRAEATSDGYALVQVADTGPGVPDSELERIFDRFYSTKRSGMGLGLPISRSIVENHGGRLWAERVPKGGTAFHLTLPTINKEEIRG